MNAPKSTQDKTVVAVLGFLPPPRKRRKKHLRKRIKKQTELTDLIGRADAIEAVKHSTAYMHDDLYEAISRIPSAETTGALDDAIAKYVADGLMELPSADATKKKAELKDNGDWDCPDVYCDECDHHRSVEWCSLAIPNHEEIDDTYKMVTEAFFEGFDAAEKRYRFLIEYVEELDKKSADVVTIHEDGTLEVKVPNAQKVGRVLVMDTDSHIGGGLFYPDDAVQSDECDHCVYKWGMKGGDE